MNIDKISLVIILSAVFLVYPSFAEDDKKILVSSVEYIKSGEAKVQVVTLENGSKYEIPFQGRPIRIGDEINVTESSKELKQDVKAKHPNAKATESVELISQDTPFGRLDANNQFIDVDTPRN